MDSQGRAPLTPPGSSPDRFELSRMELEAAIKLVAGGSATIVWVTGLPDVEAVAGVALASAQRAGVAFVLEREADTGTLTAKVGPRV